MVASSCLHSRGRGRGGWVSEFKATAQPGLHCSWTARVNRGINDITDVGALCVRVSSEEATATVFPGTFVTWSSAHLPGDVAWTGLTPTFTHQQPGVEMHQEGPDLGQLSNLLLPIFCLSFRHRGDNRPWKPCELKLLQACLALKVHLACHFRGHRDRQNHPEGSWPGAVLPVPWGEGQIPLLLSLIEPRDSIAPGPLQVTLQRVCKVRIQAQ